MFLFSTSELLAQDFLVTSQGNSYTVSLNANGEWYLNGAYAGEWTKVGNDFKLTSDPGGIVVWLKGAAGGAGTGDVQDDGGTDVGDWERVEL